MKSRTFIEDDLFVKICTTEQAFKNELLIYKLGLKVTPSLITHNKKDTIYLDIINGRHPNPKNINDVLMYLDTLCSFHQALRNKGLDFAHNDVNPKNFLIDFNNENCYLLDFSEISESGQDADLVNFFLFVSDMCIPTVFNETLNYFLMEYRRKYNISTKLIKLQISFFDARRKKYKSKNKLSENEIINRAYLNEQFERSFT